MKDIPPCDIHECTGISLYHIQKVFKANGIKPVRVKQKPRPISERNLSVIELYEQGLSMRAIAKRFGCTHQRIHGILRRYDVVIRPMGQPRIFPLGNCAWCHKECSRLRKYCSKRCYDECRAAKPEPVVTLTCHKCGQIFRRTARLVYIAKWNGCVNTYCGKFCYLTRKTS